mmetsp:Transcript_15280/g.59763  ORF Transcript_15280/g.59763 Transcript_15280/m.59763 type:complete len:295 (+) Transcript_15280:312-1196(+)
MPHGSHPVLQAVQVPGHHGPRAPGVPGEVVSRDRGDEVRAVPQHVSPVLHRRGEADEARARTGAGGRAGGVRAPRRADGQLPGRLRQAADDGDGFCRHQPQLHARGRGRHATARAREQRRGGQAVQREHARRGHRLLGAAAGGEHGRATRRERRQARAPTRARRRRPELRPRPGHREPPAQLLGPDRGVDAVRVSRAVHHRGHHRGGVRLGSRFVPGFHLQTAGVHAAAAADRSRGVRLQAAARAGDDRHGQQLVHPASRADGGGEAGWGERRPAGTRDPAGSRRVTCHRRLSR